MLEFFHLKDLFEVVLPFPSGQAPSHSAGASLFYVYTVCCTDIRFLWIQSRGKWGLTAALSSSYLLLRWFLTPFVSGSSCHVFLAWKKSSSCALTLHCPVGHKVISAHCQSLLVALPPPASGSISLLSRTVFLALSISMSSRKAQITWTLERGSNAVRADSVSYWKPSLQPCYWLLIYTGSICFSYLKWNPCCFNNSLKKPPPLTSA